MSGKIYKIAVIGDSLVGKTSLVRSFFDVKFSEYHVGQLCENEATDVAIGRSTYKVKLVDTAGPGSSERSDIDCFLLCYSIENRLSFANVKNKWVDRLKSNSKWNVPVILVATKVDLRDELPNVPFLTTADGRSLCEDINAKIFIETSAREDVNTKTAVEEALRTVIPPLVVPSIPDLSKAGPKIVVASKKSEKEKRECCGCCQS